MEIICPTCNSRYNIHEDKTLQEKRASINCKNCGGKIPIELNQNNSTDNDFEFIQESLMANDTGGSPQITKKEFIDFIGPNADKYIEKFRKFNVTGVDQFSFTWHWPAFFVTFFWMFYRKLYLWALLVFILTYIPIAGLILMIVYGLTGNYLYYRHAKKKIME